MIFVAVAAVKLRAFLAWWNSERSHLLGMNTMARAKPRTKAGKARKVAKVLREAKAGRLRTSAGKKVTKKKQKIAIALSEAGLSKKRKKK